MHLSMEENEEPIWTHALPGEEEFIRKFKPEDVEITEIRRRIIEQGKELLYKQQ